MSIPTARMLTPGVALGVRSSLRTRRLVSTTRTAFAPRLSSVGALLRGWRERRRLSQLALAVEAEVSTRHLSFVETGRAQPSREMVLLLARALDVPARARNELLTAAGYAPIYRERGLEAPELADVRRGLEFMLRQQEPFPALVLDGGWNIVLSNRGAQQMLGDRYAAAFAEGAALDIEAAVELAVSALAE